LLGHLSGNASQADSRFLELDLFLELCVGFYGASFVERDFANRIRDVVDNFTDGIDINFARLRIDASSQFFIGFEVLTGSDNDRVLDRVNYDLWIDPFFSTDLIDRLKKYVRHQ